MVPVTALLTLISLWAGWTVAAAPGAVLFNGKLTVRGGQPVLQTPGREFLLTSEVASVAATLRDERNSGRNVRVAGRVLEDGRLEVQDFHVVRGERLLRLAYYCDT